MTGIICPVCGEPLLFSEKAAGCERGHCFDIARSGYINLLMSNQSGKRHGDDRVMVAARRAFLDRGFYLPLLEQVSAMAVAAFAPRSTGEKPVDIVDVGCGDCWYTAGLLDRLGTAGIPVSAVGIDISRDALRYAANRDRSIRLLVASAYKMPLTDSCCDLAVSIFAPIAETEICRILRPNGLLLCVTPMERHLLELKQAVYDSAYENPPESGAIAGFEPVERAQVAYTLELRSNEEIENLFKMTPYYYKTGERDQCKLKALNSLDVQAQFCVTLYRVQKAQ